MIGRRPGAVAAAGRSAPKNTQRLPRDGHGHFAGVTPASHHPPAVRRRVSAAGPAAAASASGGHHLPLSDPGGVTGPGTVRGAIGGATDSVEMSESVTVPRPA